MGSEAAGAPRRGVITFLLQAAEASQSQQGRWGMEGTGLGIRKPYLRPPAVCAEMCLLLYIQHGHWLQY